MKLIEVTMCFPKFANGIPKDESEVLLKKAYFIPQNIVALFEETEKPMVKTRVELAGQLGFLVTETIDELAMKINEQLALDCK